MDLASLAKPTSYLNSITITKAMSQQQYARAKLHAVRSRISKICLEQRRSLNSVKLIGASKKQSPDLIREFLNLGLEDLGENYLQEGISKIESLIEPTPTWHFIGQIQSNKTKLIANNFDWVHGVDRLKIATRLAKQNTREQSVKILLQLNLDDEHSKGGVSQSQAPELANQIAQEIESIGGAELRGFMTIPKARNTYSEQTATFAKARNVLELTNQQFGIGLTELSMGMSGDLEAAIAEGATMVRIGTDLFGPRD